MIEHVRVLRVLQVSVVDVLVQVARRELRLGCQLQVGLAGVADGALLLLTSRLSNNKLGLRRRITLDLRDLLFSRRFSQIDLRSVVGCLLLLDLRLLLLAGNLCLDKRVFSSS